MRAAKSRSKVDDPEMAAKIKEQAKQVCRMYTVSLFSGLVLIKLDLYSLAGGGGGERHLQYMYLC